MKTYYFYNKLETIKKSFLKVKSQISKQIHTELKRSKCLDMLSLISPFRQAREGAAECHPAWSQAAAGVDSGSAVSQSWVI